MRKIGFVIIGLMLGGSLAMAGDGLELKSDSFKHKKEIPNKHSLQGGNRSPAFSWSNIPKDTKSFALICIDPDAPSGDFIHWVIYQIPGSATALPEGVPPMKKTPEGAVQGINSFGQIGYAGPMPPPGENHKYEFTLYALDYMPDLASGLTHKALLKEIRKHTLDKAEYVGKYRN